MESRERSNKSIKPIEGKGKAKTNSASYTFSTLNLIDLAGSECGNVHKSVTPSNGVSLMGKSVRQNEMSYINKVNHNLLANI